MINIIRRFRILLLLFFITIPFFNFAKNVVIVIIDGARYSETFLNEESSFTPRMWNMSKKGTYIKNFYNDSATYTSAAIPSLWCGTWTERRDTVFNGSGTQYTSKPSIFEYFRKQKNIPAEKCLYSLAYVNSLWLQSFHPYYGQQYWPYTISKGNNDNDVLQNTLEFMLENHPQLTVMYLADVDHEGHSGNWNRYTSSIENADQIVEELWENIQQDKYYNNNTTLIVTNDHGRHDAEHGDFKGHGDGCEGCRHIMFLAIGPTIKSNFASSQKRRLPDVAVTAASLLDTDMEFATGEIAAEIFKTTNLKTLDINANWSITSSEILINYPLTEHTTFAVFNSMGKKVNEIQLEKSVLYQQRIRWDNGLGKGVYIIQLNSPSFIEKKKIIKN